MQNKYYHGHNIHIFNKHRLQSSPCVPSSPGPNPLPKTKVLLFGVWQRGWEMGTWGPAGVGECTEFLERDHQYSNLSAGKAWPFSEKMLGAAEGAGIMALVFLFLCIIVIT